MTEQSEIERLRRERDELVNELRDVLSVYALQAARDRADPKMVGGWRKLQDKIIATLSRVQEGG